MFQESKRKLVGGRKKIATIVARTVKNIFRRRRRRRRRLSSASDVCLVEAFNFEDALASFEEIVVSSIESKIESTSTNVDQSIGLLVEERPTQLFVSPLEWLTINENVSDLINEPVPIEMVDLDTSEEPSTLTSKPALVEETVSDPTSYASTMFNSSTEPIATVSSRMAPPRIAVLSPTFRCTYAELPLVAVLLCGLAVLARMKVLKQPRHSGKLRVKGPAKKDTTRDISAAATASGNSNRQVALPPDSSAWEAFASLIRRCLLSPPIQYKCYRISPKLVRETSKEATCDCAKEVTTGKISRYQRRDLAMCCCQSLFQYEDERAELLKEALQQVKGEPPSRKQNNKPMSYFDSFLSMGAAFQSHHHDDNEEQDSSESSRMKHGDCSASTPLSSYSPMASNILNQNRFFPAMVLAFTGAPEQQQQEDKRNSAR